MKLKKRSLTRMLSLLPIFIAVFSIAFCFPVSAESSFEALPITVTKLWSNNYDDNTFTQSAENYVTVYIPYHSTKSQFASIWNIQNSDTSNYYDYKFQFGFSMITPSDFTCTLNGVSYEVKKDTALDNTYYVEISQVKLSTANARLDFNFTWNYATSGNLYVLGYYRLSDVNAILENQDKNASEIMQNQNENTQSQIDNDNAIKDEILYGAEFDDSTASDESFGNYDKVESDLIDSTQSNAEVATQEVNDNLLGSLQRMRSGLSAVAGMFTDMLLTKIPDLNIIVWFSLALGVVPLLVGLSVQGLRSRDAAAARQRSSRRKKE